MTEPPRRFPDVPHGATGVKCGGYIVADLDRETVTLKCSLCGAIVGSVNRAILHAFEEALTADALNRQLNETMPDGPIN